VIAQPADFVAKIGYIADGDEYSTVLLLNQLIPSSQDYSFAPLILNKLGLVAYVGCDQFV